jgi:hypothetical protein
MEVYGDYMIYVDKRWSLEDLYLFPRAYEQVYFAYEALIPAADDQMNERILRAFNAFPWRGGYSAVSFYNQLKYATPKERRPIIRQIRYASPGYIELVLAIPLAIQIAGVVGAVAGSLLACNKLYNTIYTDAQKRELLALDIKSAEIDLANKQLDFIKNSNEKLAEILMLESAVVIESRAEHPLIAMKILMSIYRRVRTLAEYHQKGKAKLSHKLDKDGDHF